MNFTNNRCAICQTKNKQKKLKVCDDCVFVNEFVTKWGRENLRAILNSWLLEKQNIVIDKKESCDEPANKCKSQSCSCHNRRNTLTQSLYAPCAPPYDGKC